MNTTTTKHVVRSVRIPLQSGKKDEFTKLFNSDVLPMLKAQDGFANELMMVNDQFAVGVSVWKGKDALNKYASATYPKIEEKLRGLTSGTPQVETFELSAVNTLTA